MENRAVNRTLKIIAPRFNPHEGGWQHTGSTRHSPRYRYVTKMTAVDLILLTRFGEKLP